MKFLLLIVLILTACNNSLAEPPNYKQDLSYINATEFKKFGKVIPEKLKATGFTENTLTHYYCLGTVEYFAFSDWRTEKSGDVVTFVVVDGEVKNWFKEGEEGKEAVEI